MKIQRLKKFGMANLDMYLFRVPSDRVETRKSIEKAFKFLNPLVVHTVYLLNPSISETVSTHFQLLRLRFALNYLMDRNLIVNELIGGYGNIMISNYGVFSADYLSIIDELRIIPFQIQSGIS